MYISITNIPATEIDTTSWYLFDKYTDNISEAIWSEENSELYKTEIRIPNSYLSLTAPRYIKAVINKKNGEVINYPLEQIKKRKMYTNYIIKDPVEKPILRVLENKLSSTNGYLKLGITNIRTQNHKQKSVTIIIKNLKNEIVFQKIFEGPDTEFTIYLNEISNATQLEDVDIFATQTSITGQSSEIVSLRLRLGGVIPNIKNIQLNAFNPDIDNRIELTTNEFIKRIYILDNTDIIFDRTNYSNDPYIVIPANTLLYTRNYKMVLSTVNGEYSFYIFTISKQYKKYDLLSYLNYEIIELFNSDRDLNMIKGYITRGGYILSLTDDGNKIKIYDKNLHYLISVDINLNIDISKSIVEFINAGINNTFIIIYENNNTHIIKLFHNSSFTIVDKVLNKTLIDLKSNVMVSGDNFYFIDKNDTLSYFNKDGVRTDLITLELNKTKYRLEYLDYSEFFILCNDNSIYIYNKSLDVLDKLVITTPNNFFNLIKTAFNIKDSKDLYLVTADKIYLYKHKDDLLEEHDLNNLSVKTFIVNNGVLLLKTNDKLYRLS